MNPALRKLPGGEVEALRICSAMPRPMMTPDLR
jgi:hypothetical protein